MDEHAFQALQTVGIRSVSSQKQQQVTSSLSLSAKASANRISRFASDTLVNVRLCQKHLLSSAEILNPPCRSI